MAQLTGSTRIARVEVWKCVVPLPAPFTLGATVVAQRDYAVVRLVTEDGTDGAAYGLSRGAPIDVIVAELLAPHLLGQDATDPAALASTLAARLPQHGSEGLVQRALSLIDIAAWDIKGKVAGEPVWQLLGGERGSAPVMLVEGYPLPDEDDDGFAERIGRRAAEGYSMLKLEASMTDQDALARRMAATRKAVGDLSALTVDLAYIWGGHDDVAERAARWPEHGVAWVEDPLHGNDAEGLGRVHAALPVPLAAGDEVTNPQALLTLVAARAVDIVRIDVTCVGGITGFARLHQAATEVGVRISTHVYPELHRHVVFAYPGSGPVEMFPEGGRWDGTGSFCRPMTVRRDADGVMVVDAPTEPGLGIDIDWSAVQAHSVRHQVVRAESAAGGVA
ncbi:mandelate racemase/muconate lactonizing enzyme family protein [Streptomyces sp. NPDC005248]|uniref:mandelate racemase/muconate lactonizing enzyme family protein n=1 Tax=Streptomyces sp. NPDC005248 TaxID=3364709 RepID=UPI00369B3612